MSVQTKAVIYGASWCGDCFRTRRFFQAHSIPYEWIDIDRNKVAEEFVLKTSRGMRSIPTIVFPDGSILVEPSSRQLAQKFGIKLT